MHNKSRLKIWVCEFVSAGGLASAPLPASLLQEGMLMRDALLTDLHTLGVDCITSHDYRVAAPANVFSTPVHPNDDVFAHWRALLATDDIDACWIIAPETESVLYDLQQMVTAAGKIWIGCSAEAIQQTAAKSVMANICQQAGIAVLPHAFLANTLSFTDLPWFDFAQANGWVIKPDDGAGCEFTYYFNKVSELTDFKNKIIINNPELYRRLIVQPYVSGEALSMSVLSSMDRVQVIAGHQQIVNIESGAFCFAGAGVNAAAVHLPAMQQLAEQIKLVIPGLLAYWGADMILSADHQWILVEINPRLTTPYIGLSALLSENPAALIMDTILKNQLPAVQARASSLISLTANAPTRKTASI